MMRSSRQSCVLLHKGIQLHLLSQSSHFYACRMCKPFWGVCFTGLLACLASRCRCDWAVPFHVFVSLTVFAECRRSSPKSTTLYQGHGFCPQTMDCYRTTPRTCAPRKRWEHTSSSQPMGRRVMGKSERLSPCLVLVCFRWELCPGKCGVCASSEESQLPQGP